MLHFLKLSQIKPCLRQFLLPISTARLVSDFSHTIIGGGVVGLACAVEFAKKSPSNRVLLLEKNSSLGQETTLRNSEVIHAGIYYPKDSLKTKFCIEGSRLLYQIPSLERKKVGKWIIAQDELQEEYLINLAKSCIEEKGIDVEFISLNKAKLLEPAIMAKKAILNSPNSGILSAHSLMDYLMAKYQKYESDVVLNSEVVALDKISNGAYEVTVKDIVSQEIITICSDNVINAAGLYSDKISNMLLPKSRHVKYSLAKGNYFTISPLDSRKTRIPSVSRLVYPTPIKGLKGLGTHLTVSLDGQIKFGPDHELVDQINYTPNSMNVDKAYKEIIKYFPHISDGELVATYSGIRPQLPSNGKFQDFIIREEEGFQGFVNLLNIDSPGLTSSMAIAKYVGNLL